MHAARFRKLGSLIGLIAILMMALAPAISQMTASHHRLADALQVYCSASLDDAPAPHDGKPAQDTPTHWQACPYCGFAAHATVLPGHPIVFAVPHPGPQIPIASASPAIRTPLIHTVAQSRAPPAFS